MKKCFTFLLFSFIMFYTSWSQLTVNAFANFSTVCSENSTSITATATPVSYNVTTTPTNLIGDFGTKILADPAGITGVTPIPRSAGVNNDDCRWDNIPIDFTFTYFGSPYSTVNVSSNGWISFSASSTTTGIGFVLPNAAEANNAVHGVTSNLTFASAVLGGVLEYYTDGVAPNRVFVVSYQNAPFVSGGGNTTFQIQLHENGNIIQIHTQSCSNTSAAKAQGIENSGGTVATVVTGRNNTTNWTSTGYANSYNFTPDVINYVWLPGATLNTTTGAVVIASPLLTTTYTINATNVSNGATGSRNITINVDPASFVLAGTAGGTSICQNISVVSSGTNYRDGNCNLIANITPNGASPVTNVVNTCTKVDAGSTKRGTSDLYVARKYDIEPQVNAATATATIKLYYLQSEFDNFNTKAADSGHKPLPTGPADATGINNILLRQFHGTGTTPTNYTGGAVDFTNSTPGFSVAWNGTRNWWEVNVPVNGFSGFYLSSAKTGSLAILLNYFTGVQINKQNKLSWKVNCTSTQAKFEVQRSNDGLNFTAIHVFTADKIRCDNPFDYVDIDAPFGKNFYRIKFIDTDGKTTISQTVLLVNSKNNFEIVGLHPNLITNEIPVLKIEANEKQQITVALQDYTGKTIQKQITVLQIGHNTIPIQCSTLNKGMYIVAVYSSNQKANSIKFIKQ